MEKNQPRNYRKLAWHAALRNLPREVRVILRCASLWEDVKQEVALCAFMAERDGLDTNQTVSLVNRTIYRAMRAMGFRRPRSYKGYVWASVQLPAFFKQQDSLPDFNHRDFRLALRREIAARLGNEPWKRVWSWARSKNRDVPRDVAEILKGVSI